MRLRPAFPFCLGAFLRQVFLILAIAVLGTAESRAQATFNMEQIDALTAPIALYPDTLLAQVMIASTYPAEVAQAGQWAQQNSSLQGAALDSALQQQPWDPSVKALVQTPTVLQQMNAKMDWTQQLGDAVLAQQSDVMDSVQRLRQRAQGAGNLMTTEQQRIVTEPATVPGAQQTIVIEQANPEVLYVPSYNPTVVYGSWPYPSYPPYYWPTPVGYGYPGYAFGSGLAWGAGFAIGAAAWGNAFNWGGGDINVNANRNNFTNINNNRANNISNNRQNWQHNAADRRGSNYRDTATREKFGKTNTSAANARRESRGFDQAGRGNQGQLGQGQLGQQRPNQGQLTQQLGQQRGGQGQFGQGQLGQQRPGQGQFGQGQLGQQRPNQGQLTQQLGQQRAGQGQFGQGQFGQQRGNAGNQFAQNRSNMERRGQANGFDGAGNGARARQASARGSSSRQMMAQNRGGGGAGVNRGGGGARPSVSRGGGGGGRGGGGGGRGGGGGGRGGGGRR